VEDGQDGSYIPYQEDAQEEGTHKPYQHAASLPPAASTSVESSVDILSPRSVSSEEQRLKLMSYERLFFQLDEDASLEIDADECLLLLSYAVLDLDPSKRAEVMRRFDASGDGKLNRFEFCKLCVEELWDVSWRSLEIAVQNMTMARSSRKRRNNAYWNRVAERTDASARAIVPSLYILAMIYIFSIDLTDDYDSDVNVPMFSGFGHIRLPTGGAVAIGVYCAAFLLALAAWLQVTSVAKKKRLATEGAVKKAAAEAATRAEQHIHAGMRLASSLRQKTSNVVAVSSRVPEMAPAMAPASAWA